MLYTANETKSKIYWMKDTLVLFSIHDIKY